MNRELPGSSGVSNAYIPGTNVQVTLVTDHEWFRMIMLHTCLRERVSTEKLDARRDIQTKLAAMGVHLNDDQIKKKIQNLWRKVKENMDPLKTGNLDTSIHPAPEHEFFNWMSEGDNPSVVRMKNSITSKSKMKMKLKRTSPKSEYPLTPAPTPGNIPLGLASYKPATPRPSPKPSPRIPARLKKRSSDESVRELQIQVLRLQQAYYQAKLEDQKKARAREELERQRSERYPTYPTYPTSSYQTPDYDYNSPAPSTSSNYDNPGHSYTSDPYSTIPNSFVTFNDDQDVIEDPSFDDHNSSDGNQSPSSLEDLHKYD